MPSSYVENLGRAATLLKRLHELGQESYEGVSMVEIVGDVLQAQHQAITAEAQQRIIFRCDVDESGGVADVIELHGFSRKVPCD